MSDDLDALLEQLARDEQDDADRQRGEAILRAADPERRQRANTELLRNLAAAHRARLASTQAEEDQRRQQ
jgi:hypothetical protein